MTSFKEYQSLEESYKKKYDAAPDDVKEVADHISMLKKQPTDSLKRMANQQFRVHSAKSKQEYIGMLLRSKFGNKKLEAHDKHFFNESEENKDPCWKGYKQLGMKKKNGKEVPNCIPEEMQLGDGFIFEDGTEGEIIFIYEEEGKPLNKPMKGDVKKSKVYVKNEKGNVVKVEFGDKNMSIKKHIPERRKSFRARHNCDNPGPKTKARYWSCKAW